MKLSAEIITDRDQPIDRPTDRQADSKVSLPITFNFVMKAFSAVE